MILVLGDKTEWDESTRTLVFTVLAVVCVFGSLTLIALRPSVDAEGKTNEVKERTTMRNPKQELKNAIRLLLTKDMSLLSTCFLFTGNINSNFMFRDYLLSINNSSY